MSYIHVSLLTIAHQLVAVFSRKFLAEMEEGGLRKFKINERKFKNFRHTEDELLMKFFLHGWEEVRPKFTML